MLNKLDDLRPAAWIKENTDTTEPMSDKWEGNFVSHCVPNIYSAYCKILHPIYEDLSISDLDLSWNEVKVAHGDPNDALNKLLDESTAVYGGECETAALQRAPWKELAEQRGLAFHPEINVDTFSRNFRGGSWPRYLIGPEEGFLDIEACNAIVKALSPFTGNETCYFFYELITTDDYESDLLFAGSIGDVVAAREVENVHASPTSWWPESRRWFVHTDYDLTFTLVGGPKEIVDKLVLSPELECIEVQPNHRVDYQADKINP